MRLFVPLTLLITILLGSAQEAIIYFSFKINQEYIAKNLCVEKEIENNTCQGCCQLKKKLETSSQEKKQTPNSINKNIPSIEYCFIKKTAFYSLAYEIKEKAKHNNHIHYCYEHEFAIFHPPKHLLFYYNS